MPAAERPALTEYLFHTPITTRWSDNDIYGHINNVTYYSYFDSAANRYLIEVGGLDISRGGVIGLVVESGCTYHAPLSYPTPLVAGMRVDRLGNRAVTYGMAIFAEGETLAAAHGHFVHVFVDRVTRKPVAIPPLLRDALARLVPA
ncbi:MAG: acyl-CoA thioesterase [Myxococcales bacterium]|nr:acyl-CoA thioesterase [Myxococcales bacterium]